MSDNDPKMLPTSTTFGIKAVVEDVETMEARIFTFTQTIGCVATQEDIYFNVPYGQMKLRTTHPSKSHGHLISSKVSETNPNLVDTHSAGIENTADLRKSLSLCLSELGSIRKRRRVYVKGNVRIHLDEVEGLGSYVDIEIGFTGAEETVKQATEVKNALQLKEESLVTSTYLDLYRKAKSADSGFDDETSDSSM